MFLILFVFWLIFNGKATAEVILIGALLVAALEWFMMKYLDYSVKKTMVAFSNIGKIILYVFRLIGEIVQSNIKVLEIIINKDKEIEPTIVTFETTLDSNTKKAVLANCITLTPGTITADVKGQTVTVVCLDQEFAEGIEDTVFERQLSKMKGGE